MAEDEEPVPVAERLQEGARLIGGTVHGGEGDGLFFHDIRIYESSNIRQEEYVSAVPLALIRQKT